jgi:DNA-binding IclR family transcriptional regulator
LGGTWNSFLYKEQYSVYRTIPRENVKATSSYKPIVPAVEQASRVLICLGRNENSQMRLSEICREVGIYKSKGYSILNTLRQFGFVEKDPQTKTYSLGPGLLLLSRRLLDHMDIRDQVLPFLKKAAIDTGTTALMGLISADQVFVIARHEGNQPVGVTIRIGHRFHLTAGAHGKAITAFLPEAERKRLLSRKRLFYYGDPDLMDMERLEKELEECRRKGFAKDIEGLQPGILAVSAPVFGPQGRLIGCTLLMGAFKKKEMEEKGRVVARTAREITSLLRGEGL